MDHGASHSLPSSLVSVIRSGAEGEAHAAFETLYRATYDSLFQHAYAILRSRDEARDVVADVFLALWRIRTTWHPPVGVRAYLFAAVRNRAMNIIRDDARRGELHIFALHSGEPLVMRAPEALPDEHLVNEERVQRIHRLLDALHGPQREVVLLRWRQQLSFAEIAGVMGCSENAVKLQMSRAVRILRTVVSGINEME